MNREEIINRLKKYFKVRDLVCDHVYHKFGEHSWQVLRTELLHTILVVREDILQSPIIVNHGKKRQRGFRCNIYSINHNKQKAYISAHTYGAAIDFTCLEMTAQMVRNKIFANAHKLPYPVRLERGVSWVHIDINDKQFKENGKKVYLFNP